jgi:hypothetical protein
MHMTDATPQAQRTLHHGLAGRPRKLRRNPLAPYVGCKCGVCARCVDDAKWSRGFKKFADPTYYNHELVIAMRSPLADF